MADIKHIEINNNTYDICDAMAARRNVYYGTCTTAANTYKKVATVETFPLDSNNKPLVGTVVAIKYSNTNTYKTEGQTYQLNVNSTGDYPMYYNNAALATSTSANTLVAGYKNRHIFYMFDGSHWVWLTASYDSNTTYSGMTQAEVDAGTSTTNRLISPQRLRDNFYTEDEVDALLGAKANSADLATVATSGSYNDLTNKPTNVSSFTNDSGFQTKQQTLLYINTVPQDETFEFEELPTFYDDSNNVVSASQVKALFDDPSKDVVIAVKTINVAEYVMYRMVQRATNEPFYIFHSAFGADPTRQQTLWFQLYDGEDWNWSSYISNISLMIQESMPSAATSTPLMDGTAAVGSSSKYAKEDHVHPSDTSKVKFVRYEDADEMDADTSQPNGTIGYDANDEDFYIYESANREWRGLPYVANLASVALSGNYNDLFNKPTIPAAVTVDSSLTGSSQTNPVQGGAIYSALEGKEDRQRVIVDIQCDVNQPIGYSVGGNTITGAELYALCADPKKNVVLRIIGYDNNEDDDPDYSDDILYYRIQDSLSEYEEQFYASWWSGMFLLVGLCIESEGANIYFEAGIEEFGYVPTIRKVNNKPLSADITLTASDVGAMSTSHPANAITSVKISEWNGKADPVPIVTVSTTGAVTQALDPNKFYDFTGSPTSLTLTLNSGTGLCIYAGKFTAGTGFSNLSFPASVKVAAGCPDVEAGGVYEFSVMDNLLLLAKES